MVTGFDISGEALAVTTPDAEKAGVHVTTVKASCDTFDYGSDRWDLIVLAFAWAPVTDPAFVATKGELGPHRTEQPGPHPHQCPFDPSGRFVVVPDKGFDRLFIFTIDTAKGTLVPAAPPFTRTRSGAGRRHIAFHPRLPYAWVINELDSTVTAYRFGHTGTLEAIQIVPSLPSTFTGDNTDAAIVVAPSGRFVYASNRGHESVAIFRVDESNGMLSPVRWESTKGSTPRFIGLTPAGTRLFAANQRSDSIVEFQVDQETGTFIATGQENVKQNRAGCFIVTTSDRPQACVRRPRVLKTPGSICRMWGNLALPPRLGRDPPGFEGPSSRMENERRLSRPGRIVSDCDPQHGG